MDKLDACYRKHRRTITGYQRPNSLISNKVLYKICYIIPLSAKVAQQQWTMFGYVQRMPGETPTQESVEFAVIGSNNYRERRGRHCLISCSQTSKMQDWEL